MERPLNMLRRNDMHLPKPSAKLMNRRNPVRMSGGRGRRRGGCGRKEGRNEGGEEGGERREGKRGKACYFTYIIMLCNMGL